MIAGVLEKLARREDLTAAEARTLLAEVFAGTTSDIEIAGLLMALATKGETVSELVGFATAMREAAADLGLRASLADGSDALSQARARGLHVVDTCGTGGNARRVFNISTAAAFVVAGAGVPVAKHGNRSHTSRSGSADVMAALGVNLELPPLDLGRCLRQVGIVFLFAPRLHPSMRHVQSARQALRVRTIFNLLGPLTNPAGATAQLVGVSAAAFLPLLAEALQALGTQRAFVVRGDDGIGEISTTGPTQVAELRDGRVHRYVLDAADLGLRRAPLAALAGEDAETNARLIRAVLEGRQDARRDIVLVNAAAALVAAGRAASLEAGLTVAAESIDTGAALRKLEELAEFSQTHTARAAAQPRAS